MNTILQCQHSPSKPRTLDDNELLAVIGGSRLSRQTFWLAGYLFESFNQAAINGAPHGNIYRHSG